MALTIPSGLRILLDSGDCISHSCLDITLNDGTPLALATAEIVVPGPKTYHENLRLTGDLKRSLRAFADRVTLTAQNITSLLGETILASAQLINSAPAIFSRIYIADDGTIYQLELINGEITGAEITETDVEFTLISRFAAGGNVAGHRTLGAKNCQFTLGDQFCGSPSTGTCSRIYDDAANGCISKLPAPRLSLPVVSNNQPSFGGSIDYDSAVASAGTTPGVIFNGGAPAPGTFPSAPGGGGGGGFWRVPIPGMDLIA